MSSFGFDILPNRAIFSVPPLPCHNTTEIVLDELDRRVKEKQPTSVQHMWELLQDCWKSIPGEAERIPRVWKAVIKTKGGYFEESKIYFDLFNTFLVTT